MSLSTVILTGIPQIDKKEIIDISGLSKHKIWNIYLYGSRVYGTYDKCSDYDLLVVANSLDRHKEIKGEKYNIHIHTPDKFQDDLWNYRLVNLECIYAPNFAKLQERKDFNKFIPEKNKVKKYLLTQSHDSWIKGKIKLRDGDTIRGSKSIFHSLRILLFGLQIVEYGEIIDFSEANYYWEEISEGDHCEWEYFKDKFLPRKRNLEKLMREA